ncbi:MAG: 16S rRNA (cytidine(1402)-2'-O)-methyltransferase [Alphaproteobacteria bacterium]
MPEETDPGWVDTNAGTARSTDPGLYLVATPIGNLRDITLRALDVLAGVDVIAAEDTRITARLLARYGISKAMVAYHEHNAARARPALLRRLAGGGRVALVSDAGTPLISDPGYRLVAETVEAGAKVFPVPGASSVLAALVGAGLPTDRFLFAGFLPSKPGQRRSAIQALAGIETTLVLLEAPSRLAASLADLADMLGPRPAVVARELTKLHEEFARGTLPEVAARYAGDAAPKGEITLVIGPGEAVVASEADIDAALVAALADVSLREAVERVTAATGWKRRQVYARALALKPE